MVRWLPRVWPLLLAFGVLAPLLAPGYVLSYDMVFVPDQDLRSDFFGLRSVLPRAVPSDAVVAVLSVVLPGALLQKLALLAILAGAGWGVARLTRDAPLVARLVAITVYVWNPFVAERLLLGQWAVLAGFAALPWVVSGALAVRQGSRRGAAATVLAIAVAALSPSGGVTALGLAALLVCWPGCSAPRRDRLLTLAGALAVNAPWIVTGLLSAAQAVSGQDAVEAFAARAEGHVPVVGTVLTLGGVWNADTVPDSRLTWVPVVWLVVGAVVASLGLRDLRRHLTASAATALLVGAVVSLVISLAGTVWPSLLGAVTDVLPGAALFRDGSRYLGPLALVQALLVGFGAARVLAGLAPSALRWCLGAACVVAPLAVLPDLAWGVAGRLEPVDYPASWEAAREAVEADGRPGDILVLPASPYRAYPWNGGQPGLDPAGRYFPVVTRMSEALRVDGVVVQEEDPATARAISLYDAGDVDGLAGEGIGYVLIDVPSEGGVRDALTDDLDRVFVGPDLVVFGVPESTDSQASTARVALVIVGWVVAGGAVSASVVLLLRRRDADHSPTVHETK